jgi:lysylphosphatidylglycerol synthetase-like protein (DUF2156 family)
MRRDNLGQIRELNAVYSSSPARSGPTSFADKRGQIHGETSVPAAVRVELLRQYGTTSQAYSAAFQPELEHFGDDRGFIAYKKIGRTALVLSDPIAPPENIPDLISRFLEQHPDAGFWYLSPPVARVLAARGFYVNTMGHDTWIELTNYDFSGPKKKPLREAVNRMVKRGFVTREGTLAEVGIDKIRGVSEGWRATKTIRSEEVAFLNRPWCWPRSRMCAASLPSIVTASWWLLPSLIRCMKGAR